MAMDDFEHPLLGYGDQQLIEALEHFGISVSQWKAAYLTSLREALDESFADPSPQPDGSLVFRSPNALALYGMTCGMAGVFALRACQPPHPPL
ncbi:MAG: hypothetical protein HY534_04660 [Chloroflexi bacterium]|nr:hypothetical protein [Chloroflexota bacterium]